MGSRSALLILAVGFFAFAYVSVVRYDVLIDGYSDKPELFLTEGARSVWPMMALEVTLGGLLATYYALFASAYARKMLCLAYAISQLAAIYLFQFIFVPEVGIEWPVKSALNGVYALVALFGFFTAEKGPAGEKAHWIAYPMMMIYLPLLGLFTWALLPGNFEKAFAILQPDLVYGPDFSPAVRSILQAWVGVLFQIIFPWLMVMILTREKQVLNAVFCLPLLEIALIMVLQRVPASVFSGFDYRGNLFAAGFVFLVLVLNNAAPAVVAGKAKKH
jgi:hypothetical protein